MLMCLFLLCHYNIDAQTEENSAIDKKLKSSTPSANKFDPCETAFNTQQSHSNRRTNMKEWHCVHTVAVSLSQPNSPQLSPQLPGIDQLQSAENV